jgi:hypothetical protein
VSNHQSTVIWLGLVLIALNVVIHIADLKTVLFGTASTTNTTPSQAKTPAPSGTTTTPPNVLAPGPLNSSPNQAPVLALVITMASQQPGNSLVITTAVELLGVGVFTLLAGISDDMGALMVVIMWGIVLGWALLHTNELSNMVKGL